MSVKKGLHSMNYCSLVHKEYEQGKQNLQCSRLYKENGRDIYVAEINNSYLGLSEKDITC